MATGFYHSKFYWLSVSTSTLDDVVLALYQVVLALYQHLYCNGSSDCNSNSSTDQDLNDSPTVNKSQTQQSIVTSTPSDGHVKSADQVVNNDCLTCLKHSNGDHDSICEVFTSNPRVLAKCCSCDAILADSHDDNWELNLAQPVYKCLKCTNPDNTWDYDHILCKNCMVRHSCKANKVKMPVRLNYFLGSIAPYVVPK